MRVAVLCSGGKDSTYATWWSIMRGWDVQALVTLCVTGDDS
ncbi:MAG TPA: TIGR00289 family protein, partial [Candidatus Thalassarchaeaceae archaeon]